MRQEVPVMGTSIRVGQLSAPPRQTAGDALGVVSTSPSGEGGTR